MAHRFSTPERLYGPRWQSFPNFHRASRAAMHFLTSNDTTDPPRSYGWYAWWFQLLSSPKKNWWKLGSVIRGIFRTSLTLFQLSVSTLQWYNHSQPSALAYCHVSSKKNICWKAWVLLSNILGTKRCVFRITDPGSTPMCRCHFANATCMEYSLRIHVWNIYLHWDYFKLLQGSM